MPQPYNIGELDERIDLQAESYTDDGMGGASGTWQTQETVWAHVRPQTGRERMHSDQTAAEGGYQVVIRNPGSALAIDESWRVVWRGRAMNIRFVRDSGPRDLYLVMECDRGVAT